MILSRLAPACMALLLIATSALAQTPLPPDQSYPCWLIRWGAATLTQAQIEEYKRQASAQQIAAGRACLGLPPDGRRSKQKK